MSSSIINPYAFAAAAPAFVTSFDAGSTLLANSATWNGYNVRILIPAAGLTVSGTASVRITFKAGSTEGAAVDNCFIGQQATSGDAWDMQGTPVRIQSAASNAFTVGVGSTLVSDAAAFVVDETKAHIVACHFNNASADVLASGSVTGCAYYYKSAADETSTLNVTGYTSSATNAGIFVQKIEVL